MAAVETVQGTIASLKRTETPHGVVFEFHLRHSTGMRRVRLETVEERALREGEAVSVAGHIDANGILNAQTIVAVAAPAAPPRRPSLWWLALPAVACVGSWFVVILLRGYFGVPEAVLLAGGIAAFYAAARQLRNRSIRVGVEAVAAAVAAVGLNGTMGLGVPVFALLSSLAVIGAITAAGLALIRVVGKNPKSAPP